MKAGYHGDAVSKHASLERSSIDAIGARRLPAKTLEVLPDGSELVGFCISHLVSGPTGDWPHPAA